MATIKYTTDASQSVRAQQALTKAQEDYNKKIAETPQKLSKAEKAARRLAEQADPQQKYNRQMEKLAEAVKKGGLEQEKALKLTQRYQQQLDRAGESGKRAFGDQFLSKLGAATAGFFSFGAAAGAARTILAQVEQQAQSSADAVFNSLGKIGELQQVSANEQEFLANLGYARSLVRRGIADQGTALDISFTTSASGFTKEEREFLASVGERKQVAPEKLLPFAENIGTVQSLYPGATLRDAADKLTLGAKGIKKGGFAETATQIAKFAASVKTQGFAGDDAIAALVLAENAGVPLDTAGTQVAQLFSAIDAKRLKQGSFRETIQGIQSRINAGETANEVLGNVRAIAAFRQVQGNLGRFDSLVAELGNSAGALAGRDFIASDPESAAAMEYEAALGISTDADRLLNRRENLYRAIRRRQQANARLRGDELSAWWIGTGENDFRDKYNLEWDVVAAAAYDESLPTSLRLESARYARGTLGQVGEAENGPKLDRMIDLLQQQLEEQRSTNAGGTTLQEN